MHFLCWNAHVQGGNVRPMKLAEMDRVKSRFSRKLTIMEQNITKTWAFMEGHTQLLTISKADQLVRTVNLKN